MENELKQKQSEHVELMKSGNEMINDKSTKEHEVSSRLSRLQSDIVKVNSLLDAKIQYVKSLVIAYELADAMEKVSTLGHVGIIFLKEFNFLGICFVVSK